MSLQKEEEDEDAKVSMLEIIINMLTRFMQEIVTDGSAEKKKKELQPRSKSNSTGKREAFESIVEVLRGGKGMSSDARSFSYQEPQPIIEKQAA